MIERIVGSILFKHYYDSDPIKAMRASYPVKLGGWDIDLDNLLQEIVGLCQADETPGNSLLLLMISYCRTDVLLGELWFRISEEKL